MSNMPPHGFPNVGRNELERILFDLSARVARLEADTGWIAATLINSWVNFDGGGSGGHAQAAYRRIGPFGLTRGLVKNGTAGAPIFALPVGFLPAPDGKLLFAGVDGTNAHAAFDIQVDGSVVHRVGNTAYVSLNAIYLIGG